MSCLHLLSLPACLVHLALSVAAYAADGPSPGERFENQVRPLLAARCWKCHGADEQKASLRLDSSSAVAAGGDSGPAIVPGDPEHSPMIQAIRYAGDPKMPPDGKLAETEIALLTDWVKLGAPWPRYADEPQSLDDDRTSRALAETPPAGPARPVVGVSTDGASRSTCRQIPQRVAG